MLALGCDLVEALDCGLDEVDDCGRLAVLIFFVPSFAFSAS